MPNRVKDVFSDNDSSELAELLPVSEWNFTSGQAAWSPACEALYGLAPGDLGNDMTIWNGLIHPEDASRVNWEIEQVCNAGQKHFRCEIRSGRYRDEPRWYLIDGRVIENGRRKDCRVLVLHFDITVRKTMEKDKESSLVKAESLRRDIQRQYEEAQKANRLKDGFLATVAHELRAPLSVIVGWLELLRNKEVNENELAEAVNVMRRNAKIQNRLIDDLIDAAQVARAKLSIDLQVIPIRKPIEDAMTAVFFGARSKSINISTNLQDINDELVVCCDPLRIEQVLWNVLSNAVKYTGAGGRISLFVAQIGENVEITVRDSGEGIDPAFLPFVFDSFLQDDKPGVPRPAGLGLGLAIAKHIIDLHQGKVIAESPGHGQGSTFRIVLPVFKPETMSSSSANYKLKNRDASSVEFNQCALSASINS